MRDRNPTCCEKKRASKEWMGPSGGKEGACEGALGMGREREERREGGRLERRGGGGRGPSSPYLASSPAGLAWPRSPETSAAEC